MSNNIAQGALDESSFPLAAFSSETRSILAWLEFVRVTRSSIDKVAKTIHDSAPFLYEQ